MYRKENPKDSNSTSFGSRVLNSQLADFARDVLPEPAKKAIRQIVRGERVEYPLAEPVTAKLAGYEAGFWVRNYSDWYRIVSEHFEVGYGTALIDTIGNMNKPNFIDVGCSQGFYTILAAEAGGRVTAIDPDPISQRSLKDNMGLNPDVIEQISVLNTALGAEPGSLDLHINKVGLHAPSLRKTNKRLKDVVRVPVTTMDNLVAQKRIPSPDVVKIDVEGAEPLVISGMEGILSSPDKPSHLFIELHKKYLPLFGSDPEEVSQSIINYGYTPHNEDHWDRGSEILCHFVRE